MQRFMETPKFINPTYEKNQERIEFKKLYQQREKMTFPGGEFEYIDISPEKITGKDIFIAVGTPWNWELMEDFTFQFWQAGHRVTALMHPELDLKAAHKYQPEIHRPKALETFFENKPLVDVTVIAYSYGFIDTLRKGSAGIGRLVAINPAGLSDVNPIKHSVNALKSASRVFSSEDKKSKAEAEKEQLLVKTFLKQDLLKSIKEVIGAGSTDVSQELSEFRKKMPVIIFRNIDDTLVPPQKANDQTFRKLETGGNHLGPFVREEQAQEIIATIEKMEKEEKPVIAS